jgi:hypothetical protein
MPSNQSSQIGRRYTHFTFRLGFLLGSLLVTAWMPVGQAQPANAHSKETFTYKKVGDQATQCFVAYSRPLLAGVNTGRGVIGRVSSCPRPLNHRQV